MRNDLVNDQFARGKRLVVVEDDKMVAQAMTNWLEGMGGAVKCFHSAEEALRHAKTEDDYYIVDFMLSGSLNGIQLLNQLSEKLGKPVKAALVTGDTSSTFVREMDDCPWPILHKPVNTSKLIASLEAQVQLT